MIFSRPPPGVAKKAGVTAFARRCVAVSTAQEQSQVACEVRDHVAILTLNHPERRNALSRTMLESLKAHIAAISSVSGVKAVIIRAVGPVFSSGHDLRELMGASEEEVRSLFSLCTEVMEAIRTLPKPVIAQVHALATAAGCQLVATCDLVVASEDATFATPGVKTGLFCTTPGVAVSRAVGPKKAMEMLLTGTPIGAREAERAGLVNRVVPADRLADETMSLAEQIVKASAYTLGIGKHAFYEQIALDRPAAYDVAQKAMVENALAPDAQEGFKAFFEKRSPRWKDADPSA
jgi:enoyl-CoA hydratase/carnithine racemase